MKTLNDCTRGDLVVIVWPHGSDYSVGPHGDVALRGTEQFVLYTGPSGIAAGKKELRPNAFVVVTDPETHLQYRDGLRLISNVEVLDVVEASRHHKVDVGTERALGAEGDVNDPMRGRAVGLT